MPKTVKIVEVTELEPGEGKTVEVEGVSLALFNVDGTYFAIGSACTHVGGPLGEGMLVGKEVTCPLQLSALPQVTSNCAEIAVCGLRVGTRV